MPDDEDLKTVQEAMAEWSATLSPSHVGRILLAALTDMEAGRLDHRALEGPESPDHPVWESILVLGTMADGKPRYFLYPAAQRNDDLKVRDILLATIASRPEPAATPEDVLAAAGGPNLTLAMAYYGHAQGARLLGFAWHPGVTFERAVGCLKLSVERIREKEAEASSGGS